MTSSAASPASAWAAAKRLRVIDLDPRYFGRIDALVAAAGISHAHYVSGEEGADDEAQRGHDVR